MTSGKYICSKRDQTGFNISYALQATDSPPCRFKRGQKGIKEDLSFEWTDTLISNIYIKKNANKNRITNKAIFTPDT